MKTSCLRLKLVELNFLVSFNTDDQSQTDVANTADVITYKSKSSRWTFSISYYIVLRQTCGRKGTLTFLAEWPDKNADYQLELFDIRAFETT